MNNQQIPDRRRFLYGLGISLSITIFFIYKLVTPKGENAIENETLRMGVLIAGLVFFGGGSILGIGKLLKSK